MTSANLGDELNELVSSARRALFEQGELAQLTWGAFDIAVRALENWEEDEITVQVPIGYRPDRRPMQTNRTYQKEELRGRYQLLAFQQLAINGLMQLVISIEALLGDVTRAVIRRYPRKLGSKRRMALNTILESESIEEIHMRAADHLLNEMAYKSPGEFAETFEELLSVNLLECPAYHKYIEIKVTRDIHVHNRGVANDIYVRKAGSHARVTVGSHLPVDTQYFLEAYETCLQLTEWLEERLHEHWHSSLLEERKADLLELPLASSDDGVNGPREHEE